MQVVHLLFLASLALLVNAMPLNLVLRASDGYGCWDRMQALAGRVFYAECTFDNFSFFCTAD